MILKKKLNNENEIVNAAKHLISKYNFEYLLVTLGKKGMILVSKKEGIIRLSAEAKEVFDVTGLPDTSTVKEVARIAEPDLVGGVHNIYVYKHTNQRVLMFATVSDCFAHVYDLGRGRWPS